MVNLKFMLHIIARFARKIFKKLPFVSSYVFLAISVITCLIILVPSWFDRVPILSYYISEHKLPIVYELQGKVEVLDSKGDIVNKNVEVFIGGYSTVLASTEFNLKFSSPKADELFVVIRYEIDGNRCEFTKCLMINDVNHVIKEEFIIYV